MTAERGDVQKLNNPGRGGKSPEREKEIRSDCVEMTKKKKGEKEKANHRRKIEEEEGTHERRKCRRGREKKEGKVRRGRKGWGRE